MAGTSGIRWPEELRAEIEKAQIEDLRASFTDEVIYLVKLGLKESAWRRSVLLDAKATEEAERTGEANPSGSVPQ